MSEPDGRADAFASAWKDEDAPEDVVAHSLLCLSVAEAHRDRHAEETARRDSFLARIGTRRPADFGSAWLGGATRRVLLPDERFDAGSIFASYGDGGNFGSP